MSSHCRVIVPAETTALTTTLALKDEFGGVDVPGEARLLALIDQASAMICDYVGRTFARERIRETFSYAYPSQWSRGFQPLVLSRLPVSALISVTCNGGIVDVDALDWSPDGGIVYGISSRWRTVVVYDAGYLLPGQPGRNLPHSVERACLDTAVALRHRATRGDPMVRSETIEGIGSTSYLDPALGTSAALPPTAVAALLAYREYQV